MLPNTRKDSKNNMEKDLILKCAQRKKIKKIEEEQDTDDEGNFTNNHGPVTGKGGLISECIFQGDK